jgi:Cysteine-rich secretory protein family
MPANIAAPWPGARPVAGLGEGRHVGGRSVFCGCSMMRVRASVGCGLALGVLAIAKGAVGSPLERGILEEINFARTHPAEYARLLRGEVDNVPLAETPEDADEAADFLDRQTPLPPLSADARLAAAASEHSRRQGPTGGLGHAAEDSGGGLGQRLHRRGVWAGLSAETISYGYTRPRDVVIQLIIDSGVRGRGHRMILFDPALQRAGAGCGPHSLYGEMCVIDFAGALAER